MNRRIKEKQAVQMVMRAKHIVLGDIHAPQLIDRINYKIYLAIGRKARKNKITARTMGDYYSQGKL